MSDTSRESSRFSPRNFLRARRPERFSDSIVDERPILDRALLEYHLDTLTSRSQETAFEEFSRLLAQREICPNMLPHTGPTGGGDSKVDSETYPVSDALSLGWYVGAGGNSGKERWAFACSAKKDWLPKLRGDVVKISETKRGYTKAFFVSNQYIRDKQRASVEDSFSKKYGLDVRILDRTWILDRVFTGRHEGLAISALRIAVSTRRDIRKGPLDLQRERDLQEVEQRIQDALQDNPGISFVDDCLEAALLARNLELPRGEVDGRFVRAQKAAQDHGTHYQVVLAFYEQAWAAFWSFEDYKAFLPLYSQVEHLAVDSSNIATLELLTHLWTLLCTAVRLGDISPEDSILKENTTKLEAALDRLASENHRPSTALQAQASRSYMRLMSGFPTPSNSVLLDLKRIVAESEGLVGFRLASLSDLIVELSAHFVGNSAYEDLFETVVKTAAKRKGEVVGARMLLKRGAEQLDAERPYEAIRTLGRALGNLYKHESRHEMVRALYLCAAAYERVGLLWAARGTLLNAASIATNEWWAYSDVSLAQAACYNRLKWVELQIGRVPHVLAWHEVDRATRLLFAKDGYPGDRLAAGEVEFDAIVGMLLLRSDMWQLKLLEPMPDTLEALGMHASVLALTFALGHTKGIPPEVIAKGDDEVQRFFNTWSEQPAGSELPTELSLWSTQTVRFKSVVLGCQIEVAADNTSPCVELSESFLAAIESLLSTSVLEGVVPRVPRVDVKIRRSDFAEPPFTFDLRDIAGLPFVEVQSSTFQPHDLPVSHQRSLKEKLLELVGIVLGRTFIVKDKEELDRIFRGEDGLHRAIDFTSSFGPISNVLGRTPKFQIEQWLKVENRRFSLNRREEWDAEKRRATRAKQNAEPAELPALKIGHGEIPSELSDPGILKHTEIGFESPIREALWNEARWRGVGYAAMPGVPPWMILLFENREPAAEIFTHWVRELRKDDPQNRLRVTIVKGISRTNPHRYRVVIGLNPDLSKMGKYAAMMCRIQEMQPESDTNLRMFLSSYGITGHYFLGVAAGGDTNFKLGFTEPMRHAWLIKKKLVVREAWEIGLNDLDAPGVSMNDDIIVPADHLKDAPVLQLLEWKRKQAGGKRTSKKRRGRRH